jgi:hypothetical protein
MIHNDRLDECEADHFNSETGRHLEGQEEGFETYEDFLDEVDDDEDNDDEDQGHDDHYMDGDEDECAEEQFYESNSEWADQFVDRFFMALEKRDPSILDTIDSVGILFNIDLFDAHGWSKNLREWLPDVKAMVLGGGMREQVEGDFCETHFAYLCKISHFLHKNEDYFMVKTRVGIRSCFVLLVHFIDSLCAFFSSLTMNGFPYEAFPLNSVIIEEPLR